MKEYGRRSHYINCKGICSASSDKMACPENDDPLGSFVVKTKILLQELWSRGYDRDDVKTLRQEQSRNGISS